MRMYVEGSPLTTMVHRNETWCFLGHTIQRWRVRDIVYLPKVCIGLVCSSWGKPWRAYSRSKIMRFILMEILSLDTKS